MFFRTVIPYTLYDAFENEFDVELAISADCVYQPEKISGPMDECYPSESCCDITEIRLVTGPSNYCDMITDKDMERLEELIWEEFRS